MASKGLVTLLSSIAFVCNGWFSIAQSTSKIIVYVAFASSAGAFVCSSQLQTLSFSDKQHTAQTSWLQFADLARSVDNRMLGEIVTPEDLDNILRELNSAVGLIEDSALPVSISV